MHRRREIRQLAMQLLFAWDANGVETVDEDALEVARQLAVAGSDSGDARGQAIETARDAWNARQTADTWIERLAPQWPPRRQPGVDRNILRLAVWELTNTDTPPKVVLDEAIELAKQFSTEQSAAFVNGVLDAVLKEHDALTGEARMTKPEARMNDE